MISKGFFHFKVWVVGGFLGNEAYQGFFEVTDNDDNYDITFTKRDEVEGSIAITFKDISIGEAGVWSLDETHQAYRYNRSLSKWTPVASSSSPQSQQNLAWKSIESGSPNIVYAIELTDSYLYFRDGITKANPVGTRWINTRIKVVQVSSNPFITYIVTGDDNSGGGGGEFKSFTLTPTSQNLKTWQTSLVTHNQAVPNKLSVGFGNTMAYLDKASQLFIRERLSLKNEQYGSVWQWTKEDVALSEISSGAGLFGIFRDKLVLYKTGRCGYLLSTQFHFIG